MSKDLKRTAVQASSLKLEEAGRDACATVLAGRDACATVLAGRDACATLDLPVAQASSLQKDSLRQGDHDRGYLPHWKAEDATYFVTFRLVGTLPKVVLDRLKQEQQSEDQRLCRRLGNISDDDKQMLKKKYAAKIGEYLDAGTGECWLKQPLIAEVVAGALRHFDGSRYCLHAYVIMPNHVHLLVTPIAEYTISAILHSWKSYTANEANKLLNRVGQDFWQRESYDHVVRDEDDFRQIWNYIRNNSVIAGLSKEPEDWPYWWQKD